MYIFILSVITDNFELCVYILVDMDIRIAGKYKLGRKIGSGSFGDIYLGKILGLSDAVASL